MELDVRPIRLAVCRLEADAPVPAWVKLDGRVPVSVTRTDAELSIVAPEADVPDGVVAERGWRALVIRGPLDFGLVGVIANVTTILRDAGVPVFVLSTYDTDWILVQADDLPAAVESLREGGHTVREA